MEGLLWVYLTHWGWVMHICIGKLTTIGSDNGLSPGWHQAIIWSTDGILLIGPLGTHFSEILIKIQTLSLKRYRIMYALPWQTVYALTRGLFWCLFPELHSNEGNKHQNNTQVSALTLRHKSTYNILFLTWQNKPKMTLKTRIFTHHPRVSITCFTLCWWRHNRLEMTSQWPDHCDADTWQVISNSLYIDFIHSDIHDRSCKKIRCRMSFWNVVHFMSASMC